jgi:lambda family phage portal protein
MKNPVHLARQWLSALNSPKTAQRGFAGARLTPTTQGWKTTEDRINQELRSDLSKLRARCRELTKNNDYARKFAAMCRNNIVGPQGFVLQARVEDKPGTPDSLANKAIEKAFRDWSKRCDVRGVQSFRDFCDTVAGSLPSDGEVLVRMVLGEKAGNRYNFALQAIDIARLDTDYNQAATTGSNAVIMGVEVDAYLRAVAFHILTSTTSNFGATRTRERVPASELIHAYKIEVPEQLRGIPWMAAGMLSLHHLGAFQLSALLAAEHGAKQLGFFVTPEGDGVLPAVDTVQDLQYDTLPAGTTVEVPDSRYPNDVFAPFVDAALRRTASGFGVAHHSLANNLTGVSFSSIRSGTLEERDRWMADQSWFVDSLLEPIYKQWLPMALLSGAIAMPSGTPLPASKIDKFSAHVWQPRRWEWVDPLNDMQAKVLGVTAGLLDPQSIGAQMGQGDLSDTLQNIASFQKLAASLGVALPAYDSMPGAIANAASKPKEPLPVVN